MKINRVLKFFLLTSTIVIIILQLGWAGQVVGGYVQNKIWPNRYLDAISRSADVAYGSEYLAYLDFIRRETPPNAVVVDTHTFGAPQYDDNTFLQYFLFPRMVTIQSGSACPGRTTLKDCLRAMAGPNVFFIYGPNFVIPSSVPETLKVIPFNATMGLLAPQDTKAGQ